MTNSCLLNLPREGPTAERLLRAPALSSILRAMVLAFEPEWGIATAHEHLDLVTESTEVGTFAGWLTYFAHRRGVLPALPPSVQLEPVDALGTLVILTSERFTAANPTHVALAREVSERLTHAGLLSPLHPESS
nr:Imm52 family immunity protein [Melittangium boletus]